MKSIGIITLLIIFQYASSMTLKEKGLNDWHLNNIGDVKILHFYHNAGILKGIFAITEQGTLALINANTGSLIWRKTLTQNRTIDRAIFKNECIFLWVLYNIRCIIDGGSKIKC